MIEERHNAAGQWNMRFTQRLPRDIYERMLPGGTAEFGHVIVTDAWLPPHQVQPETILNESIYTGVILDISGRNGADLEIGGMGLLWWLGDEESGRFMLVDEAMGGTVITAAGWTRRIIDGGTIAGQTWPPSELTRGIHTTGGPQRRYGWTPGQQPTWVTRRHLFDFVVRTFNLDYRVRHNGVIDFGNPGDIFPEPAPIISRTSAGHDDSTYGSMPEDIKLQSTVEEVATSVLVQDRDGWMHFGGPITNPYTKRYGFKGQQYAKQRAITENSNGVDSGNAEIIGIYHGQRLIVPEMTVNLDARFYSIPHRPVAGQYLQVFDPEIGLVDMTREIRYRGRLMHPAWVRAEAVRWTPQPGMGVYLMYYELVFGAVTRFIRDLTPFVELTTDPVSIEAGAPIRGLNRRR